VRYHHAESFLDPKVKGAVHALSNVPAQSAEMIRHGAPGLRLAFLNSLARLEGSGLQFLLLLLLTPKFGKESDLWVQLGEKSVRRKEAFFRCIWQKNPRSAICFRSARKLLS
jgi:hypothetical protein